MPIETNERETRMILGLFRPKALTKGNALSRVVRRSHAYRIGDRLALGTMFQGRMMVYAGAVLRGMMEHTFADRARPDERMNQLAKAEGYPDSASWARAMRQQHPDVRPDTKIVRLSLDQIQLSPEMSGKKAELDSVDEQEIEDFDMPGAGERKSVMRVDSLDSLAGLGGQGPL